MIYAQVDQEGTYLYDAIADSVPDEDGLTSHPVASIFDWSGRPGDSYILKWNDGSPAWVDTIDLATHKARAWDGVKASRDAAEAADFEFNGVMYQPDITKITGAVLEAMLPRAVDEPPFSIDWTVSDNSVVTLDASQMVGLGRTLAARMNAIHQKGRELRALIDNAATPAEAYGYTWDSI